MTDAGTSNESDMTLGTEEVHANTAIAGHAGRRLPFILQVATIWTNVADLPQESDGEMRYFSRAPLTGNVATTSAGGDVSFSDLEVR